MKVTKVLVCFPPGAGGNFVASIIKHLQQNVPISFGDLGHAHSNGIMWAANELINTGFDDSLENFILEFFEIQKTTKNDLMVGHLRNLIQCLKYAEKVVYIDFDFEDISEIKRKADYKNKITRLPEVDYNRIKGESWPCYQDFVNGAEVPELKDHIQSPLERWYWVLPKDLDNLHCIKFKEIFGPDGSWIFNLANFLKIEFKDSAIAYWNQYKNLQPGTKH